MPAKIDPIRQVPTPATVNQVCSFLGLVNYYSRFLPNLSTTLLCLEKLAGEDERANNKKSHVARGMKELLAAKGLRASVA